MGLATLLFAGDIMLNGVAPSANTFAGIAPVVRRADLAFANLEIPWTTATKPTARKTAAELRARQQFVLKASPGHAPFFDRAGFDVVSLANNHAMDYGWAGQRQTRGLLERAGIVFAGTGRNADQAAEANSKALQDGTRVGLISAMAFVGVGALGKTTPATATAPGVNGWSFGGVIGPDARKVLRSQIAAARKGADFVVVAVHWGIERQTVPSAYQVSLGRALIEEGADVVWGHHPHVLQGAEVYRGKPVFYSLGNLISPLPAETGMIEMMVGGRRPTYRFIPARIRGGRVAVIPAKEVAAGRRRFSSLCQALIRRYPNRHSRALL